jgi:DNA-binding response OmpR family regulator
VRLLIVSENEQAHTCIRRLLGRTGWSICSRFSFEEAAALAGTGEFAVILCDSDLSGGSWRSLMEVSQQSERPPRLIVFSRLAEVRLWAEVLNLGAYDLLIYPFEPQEVIRVTALAWQSWAREAPRGLRTGQRAGDSRRRADNSPADDPLGASTAWYTLPTQ